MRFEKRHLCDLPSCYSTSSVDVDGSTHFLFAPDAYGPCYSFDRETLKRRTVWDGPSGTMSMTAIPGRSGEFLAVQRFNPGFRGEGAELVHARCADGAWDVRTLLKLPYIHRFDILERGGIRYLLCCTICTEKKNEADWTSPGKLYAAVLPDDLHQPITLTAIADGMVRNHGYCRTGTPGNSSALTSCDQGVFEVVPPPRRDGEWTVRRIMERPVSDIALCDIDGDGVAELATIEPFHGNEFVVYRRGANGFSPLYRYPNPVAFGHVVWGGTVRETPVFLGGCRGENRELFLLQWGDGAATATTIETGAGPSNVAVFPGSRADVILVANREKGEGALYFVEDD